MASYTYTGNIDAVNGNTIVYDVYGLQLVVTTTKNLENTTDVQMVGYIKSNSSSYYAYDLDNGASNTLEIIDEDGVIQYSSTFSTLYDTRSTGTYYQLFDKTATITHGSDGARDIRFVWTFKETDVTYDPQGTLYAPSSNSTIALTTTAYTVSYDANGGIGTMSSDTIVYGNNYITKVNEFTKTGHSWIGWNELADGTGVDWTDWVNVAWKWTYTKNITLYAIWEANTYYVYFDANGGSDAPSAQSYTYASDGTIALPSTKPTRSGYTFVGWGISADDTTVKYNVGEAYGRSYVGNRTLYAIWEANTDILIYNTGKCEAVNFIEDDITAFYSTSTVVAPEFVEDDILSLERNVFKFSEIIEK